MTQHAERRAAPTLLANRGAGGAGPQSLLDLMYEGFYALYLLKNGSGPQDPAAFAEHVTAFLADVDRQAKTMGASADDVHAARYAFCAAVDEIILRSPYTVRDAWQTRPLQLALFGDQLAGEHFFHKLEDLRTRGAAHLQALEVFHMCLLMGFQGRYALDGDEKLKFMSATLGNEIARMRGKARAFALVGLGAYIGLRASLSHSTSEALAGYNDLVKLPPRAASVTITLP